MKDKTRTRTRTICLWTVAMGLMIGSVDCTGPQVWAVESTESEVGIGPKAGTWMGGGGIGFLGNTPDGTAFALNLNADGFLNRNLSLGPLLQLGLTGDMTLVGLSGQAKYWIDLPETSNRAKLFVEGGIGFAHADLRGSDTSWLIPLGVGLDYRVDRKISLTTTFLLNFTDLDLGRGNSTTVMPGLTFGLRF